MNQFITDIIADSINPEGNRVTTFLLTYPRFIHSEIMTHRVFSRNAASSRAIPIEKVIEQVEQNPAMPVRWGKNGKGMQDHGVFVNEDAENCKKLWIEAAKSAIISANNLKAAGLHKQISNRVLEPFVWMTTLVTATEWENFFSLRLHKDAQPEFQHLSYLMLKKYLFNKPNYLSWGEWHIPFGDQIDINNDFNIKLKVSVARAARTSYLTISGDINVEKDIKLHDLLADSGHWSPFEHPCCAKIGSFGNFRGWEQYRQMHSNQDRKCNLEHLLKNYEESIKE